MNRFDPLGDRLVRNWMISGWSNENCGPAQLATSNFVDTSRGLELLRDVGSLVRTLRPLSGQPREISSGRVYFAVAWLPSGWHTNYFHWTVDLLPSIIEAYRFCESHQLSLSVIVPPQTECARRPFINEWLEFLDQRFGAARKVCIPEGNSIDGRILYLVNGRIRVLHDGKIDVGMTASVLHILKSCKPEFPGDATQLCKRILISRGPRTTRKYDSDSEVENTLVRDGFEPVDFGSLTISEQIFISESCTEFAGLHGAAFANLVWSKRSNVTEVIDFRHSFLYRRSEFMQISRLVGNVHKFRVRRAVLKNS